MNNNWTVILQMKSGKIIDDEKVFIGKITDCLDDLRKRSLLPDMEGSGGVMIDSDGVNIFFKITDKRVVNSPFPFVDES